MSLLLNRYGKPYSESEMHTLANLPARDAHGTYQGVYAPPADMRKGDVGRGPWGLDIDASQAPAGELATPWRTPIVSLADPRTHAVNRASVVPAGASLRGVQYSDVSLSGPGYSEFEADKLLKEFGIDPDRDLKPLAQQLALLDDGGSLRGLSAFATQLTPELVSAIGKDRMEQATAMNAAYGAVAGAYAGMSRLKPNSQAILRPVAGIAAINAGITTPLVVWKSLASTGKSFELSSGMRFYALVTFDVDSNLGFEFVDLKWADDVGGATIQGDAPFGIYSYRQSAWQTPLGVYQNKTLIGGSPLALQVSCGHINAAPTALVQGVGATFFDHRCVQTEILTRFSGSERAFPDLVRAIISHVNRPPVSYGFGAGNAMTSAMTQPIYGNPSTWNLVGHNAGRPLP